MADESQPSKKDVRKRQILGATLRLLRRHGAGITTAQIAAEAHCSKETLYSWFHDRDGIFDALAHEQARGMSEALALGFQRNQRSDDDLPNDFETQLKANCTLLLDIMTGDAVLAVNRAAMAQACSDGAPLGDAVLAEWNANVSVMFKQFFQQGNEQRALAVHDLDEAFDNLIGLLVGDRQRRLLLGDKTRPDANAMQAVAAKAVQRWLILYAA